MIRIKSKIRKFSYRSFFLNIGISLLIDVWFFKIRCILFGQALLQSVIAIRCVAWAMNFVFGNDFFCIIFLNTLSHRRFACNIACHIIWQVTVSNFFCLKQFFWCNHYLQAVLPSASSRYHQEILCCVTRNDSPWNQHFFSVHWFQPGDRRIRLASFFEKMLKQRLKITGYKRNGHWPVSSVQC